MLELSWRGGSFAGIRHYRGLYLAYNEVEQIGPFSTYAEAEVALGISDKWGEVAHCAVRPRADTHD